jgi:16S rRNA (guanine527-N7)-methyltransferase
MNLNEFKSEILKSFKIVDADFFNNIQKYKDFLQEQNKIHNLTNLDAEEKIYGEYFYESIIPYKEIDFKRYSKILDIGSGSGIPGIVLLLLDKDIKLTIIESNNKKVDFLRKLIIHLGVEADVILQRAEEITNEQRESFDLVTSRAVAPLKILLEISVPYCKVNGVIIEPKGTAYQRELVDSKNIIKNLDIFLDNVETFVSLTNHTNNVLFFKKKNKTDKHFPRM